MTYSEVFIIVGLGNPGKQYENTRHNIGFMLLDEIATQAQAHFSFHNKSNAFLAKTLWQSREVILVKPQTYMNLSGACVGHLLSYFKVPEKNLVVIFDDLDQSHGAVKMRIGGGHGGHNGVRSILEHTPSDKFYRIKIGIGKPIHKSATTSWVLNKFSADELKILETDSFPSALGRLLEILR